VAAAVATIVGLVVVARVRSDDRGGADSGSSDTASANGPDLVIDDLRAIDLDNLRGSGEPAGTASRSYLVLDASRLPDGWAATEQGFSLLDVEDPPGHEYIYSAAITTDDEHELVLEFPLVGSPSTSGGPTGLSINGAAAEFDGYGVVWSPDGDHVARLGARPKLSTDDLVTAAQALTFRTTSTLPVAEEASSVSRDPITLGGSLDGVAWSAYVEPTPLRTMWLSVDGARGGGFENTRDSQPSDAIYYGVEASLSGVPNRGAIVYGYCAPTVATIEARLDDGTVVQIATYRRELESWFAVPIPDGVVVDTLTFVNEDGSTLATYSVPPLPPQLGGTYGGTVLRRGP